MIVTKCDICKKECPRILPRMPIRGYLIELQAYTEGWYGHSPQPADLCEACRDELGRSYFSPPPPIRTATAKTLLDAILVLASAHPFIEAGSKTDDAIKTLTSWVRGVDTSEVGE